MANDVYQLVVGGQVADEFFENVMHFSNEQTNGDDPVEAAGDLAQAFDDSCSANYIACLATDAKITGYKAKRINNGGGPYIMNPVTPVSGTVTGTSATSAPAQLIICPFQRSSKWYNGKIFLPSVPESALTGNVLSTGQVDLLADFAELLIDIIAGDRHDWTFVIWSKKVSLPFVPFDVQPEARVAIQKRRLLPKGI